MLTTSNPVSGQQILIACIAADLLPNLTVDAATPGADRLVVSTGEHGYEIVSNGGSYTVLDSTGRAEFGLLRVSLGTAFVGAVELLHADLVRDDSRYTLEHRATDLQRAGTCAAAVRGECLIIRHIERLDSCAIATRDAARPWLWEVASGDLESNACPAPMLMTWPELCVAAQEGEI